MFIDLTNQATLSRIAFIVSLAALLLTIFVFKKFDPKDRKKR